MIKDYGDEFIEEGEAFAEEADWIDKIKRNLIYILILIAIVIIVLIVVFSIRI